MHTSITKRGHIYAALLLAMPAISAAQSRAWSNIVEYTPPTPNAEADGITAGPDGNLWFTEFTGNNVGRITTAGVITEYPLPQPNSGPFLITAGPDSALWFAEQNADQIGRLTTAGSLTQYPVPTPASQPVDIAAGPDGALWFTERSGNKIGRITTAGSVTEYPVPTPDSGPYGIVAGPGRRPLVQRVLRQQDRTHYTGWGHHPVRRGAPLQPARHHRGSRRCALVHRSVRQHGWPHHHRRSGHGVSRAELQ